MSEVVAGIEDEIAGEADDVDDEFDADVLGDTELDDAVATGTEFNVDDDVVGGMVDDVADVEGIASEPFDGLAFMDEEIAVENVIVVEIEVIAGLPVVRSSSPVV